MLGKALMVVFYPWKKLKGVVSRWSGWIRILSRVLFVLQDATEIIFFSRHKRVFMRTPDTVSHFGRDPPQAQEKVTAVDAHELGSWYPWGW